MNESQLNEFSEMLGGYLDIHGRKLTDAAASLWWGLLKDWDLEEISEAFSQALREGGQPVPATIIARLPDPLGWPSPEQAWNMLPKSEADTAFVLDGQMEAMASCQDSLDRGDMIGARVAFVESYKSIVSERRRKGKSPSGWMSGGCGMRHQESQMATRAALEQAKAVGWISQDSTMPGLEYYPDAVLGKMTKALPKIPEKDGDPEF